MPSDEAVMSFEVALTLLLLAGRADSPDSVPAANCFRTHLQDAIELNQERMPKYAALTGGASKRISRRLIWSERLALPVAWYVDRSAARYLRAGIPVVCDEFVPMELTPEFRERTAVEPLPLSAFHSPDIRTLGRAVRAAFQDGGFPAVSATVAEELDRLEETPTYHCMLRHLLESTLRIANLAPIHAAGAERMRMPSPEGLSWLMIRLHLLTFEEAARLDRMAAPIQAAGIPILCQDVPPIAPFPTEAERALSRTHLADP